MSETQVALDLLADRIRSCTACPLHQTRTRAVPGMGPADADVYVMAEAPGEDEDRRGLPLIGRSGKLAAKMFTQAGIDKSRLFLSNTVRCRPPKNRDPRPEEMAACATWTEEQLAIIKPKLVVTLGNYSTRQFFDDVRIGEVHGQLTRKNGQLTFAMYHPAAALHRPSARADLEQDFQKLAEVCRLL